MEQFKVFTENPSALDSTIQAMGGVVEQNPDGSYSKDEDGNYTVRAFGNADFLKFAIKTQGYAKVIE